MAFAEAGPRGGAATAALDGAVHVGGHVNPSGTVGAGEVGMRLRGRSQAVGRASHCGPHTDERGWPWNHLHKGNRADFGADWSVGSGGGPPRWNLDTAGPRRVHLSGYLVVTWWDQTGHPSGRYGAPPGTRRGTRGVATLSVRAAGPIPED